MTDTSAPVPPAAGGEPTTSSETLDGNEETPERRLGRLIWETSHRDEGTISGTGADIIARTLIADGWSRVRALSVLALAEKWRDQALPTNSELSMHGGSGPYVDKGIEGYMEAEHMAYVWLLEQAKEATLPDGVEETLMLLRDRITDKRLGKSIWRAIDADILVMRRAEKLILSLVGR